MSRGLYTIIIIGIIVAVTMGIHIIGTYTKEALYEEAISQLTEISG